MYISIIFHWGIFVRWEKVSTLFFLDSFRVEDRKSDVLLWLRASLNMWLWVLHGLLLHQTLGVHTSKGESIHMLSHCFLFSLAVMALCFSLTGNANSTTLSIVPFTRTAYRPIGLTLAITRVNVSLSKCADTGALVTWLLIFQITSAFHHK